MNRRIKSVEGCLFSAGQSRLRRSLGAVQLILLGVGAIVGSGIFVLTSIGAERAGPGLLLAFLIAGTVCGLAALVYAELAAMIPVAGSAYTYSYVALGELLAWLVGWNLILEYSVAAAAVAVGWSGYMLGALQVFGYEMPTYLQFGHFVRRGGGLNGGAVALVVAATGLLMVGTRLSATVSTALVVIKLLAVSVFIAVTLSNIHWHNFVPFMPFGFVATEVDGVVKGVMAAAALMFFAYLGFDTVSTAAEETRNPRRSVPLGLLGSLLVCTLLYMLVAAGAVGSTPYQNLVGSSEPLASILRNLGHAALGNLIALAAIIALPTVLLMLLFGQSRIFFVMARDGLLPEVFSRVHPRFRTPHIITAVTGSVVAVAAALFSVGEIAELSNTGTLFAFVMVGIAALVLRRTEPSRRRPFRCPAIWLVAPIGIMGCAYLFASLPRITHVRFLIWTALGATVYFLYGYRCSPLRTRARS